MAAFSNAKVLVLGDLMADAYLWGKVERISPEAPVPVVSVTQKEVRLGGAANVALNLKALDAEPIVCAVIGDDATGRELLHIFEETGLNTAGICTFSSKPTTTKTRVISDGQQMLRVDEEDISALNADEENQFLKNVEHLLNTEQIQAIVFEDYNKGVLTPRVIEQVITWANERNIPTTVDPKKDNFLAYKNVTLFKPNLKELKEGLGIDIKAPLQASLCEANQLLYNQLNQKLCLITLSENGVFIASENDNSLFPAHKRDIADVSGAGDTVISVATLCLIAGCPPQEIAKLSNLAGGLVCEEVGVVPIDRNKWYQEATKLIS